MPRLRRSVRSAGRTIEGEVEIDGAYFGGHIRPKT